MKDKDNYDYLRGFIDGKASDGHKDILPEGLNSYDEVYERMYILSLRKNGERTTRPKITIVDVEIGPTKLPFQSKCKLELSNGEYIMFLFPNNITLKEWEKL